jgi:hypothetical protein
MSRNLWFVLMLAIGVMTANAQEKTEPAQSKTEAVQQKTESAEAKPEAQVKTDAAQGEAQQAPAKTDEEGKLKSVPGGKALGMSILGNQEAPTTLVIVPWKSSELGGSLGISPMLDDSRQPVDKEVFMRALRYYEIRSEKKQ